MARFRGDDPGAVGAAVDRDVTEEILTDSIPAEVVNLHRVRELPLLGLVIAGAMGTIVLVYTLAVGRRGRRRDLAVLRTIGLSSAQLRRSTAWEGVLDGGRDGGHRPSRRVRRREGASGGSSPTGSVSRPVRSAPGCCW